MKDHTIAILLAVYEPNETWLIELLDSLDRQTYPSLHLYVRDDASPSYPAEQLEAVLREHVKAFPYTVYRNERNLGSNRTFAALVEDCTEPYIAFCDQDDVWLPDKLENTMKLFLESPLHPTLICTNVSVIDGNGVEIAPRMEAHRRRHVFLRGGDLAKNLLYRNFAIGCTVLMERERAHSYLPFPQELVHDHYLAFRASLDGTLDYLEEPQLRYRVYGGNQTGVMTRVETKEDYLNERIRVFDRRIERLSTYADLPEIVRAKEWSRARLANYKRERGAMRALFALRSVNLPTTVFELVALRFPRPLFRLAIRLIQKGML